MKSASGMLSRWVDPDTGRLREPAWWLVLIAVVASQLLAFYLLCMQQVRKAEVRREQAQVAQLARQDCPNAVQGAFLRDCAPSAHVAIR